MIKKIKIQIKSIKCQYQHEIINCLLLVTKKIIFINKIVNINIVPKIT